MGKSQRGGSGRGGSRGGNRGGGRGRGGGSRGGYRGGSSGGGGSKAKMSKEEEEYIRKKFGNIDLSDSEGSGSDSASDEDGNSGEDGDENKGSNPDKEDGSKKQSITDANASGFMNPNQNSLKAAEVGQSRSEREAQQKKEAQERYMKLVAAGKTEQSKKDLERLAEVRKRRERAAQQKLEAKAAEKELVEKVNKEAEKQKAKADEFEKFTAMEIKKMKPAKLKDELKERGLSTQGQKAELITRLIEACAD